MCASYEPDHLVDDAVAGDAAALGTLLEQFRPRLRRLLDARADPRAFGRFDRSDVIQETFLEAAARLDDYCRQEDVPFFVWLRFLALQKLTQLHRHHLGAKKRDAGREVRLPPSYGAQPSSEYLAIQLLAKSNTPSRIAAQEELKNQLVQVLDGMDPADREILCLRHFEQLSNTEAAAVLGITPSGASSRYIRALVKFKGALAGVPGFADQL